ncbi:MAG TPA: hypothetical protein VNM72_14725 [Blastocatellia bacterium]|nr:hypothetical protein [Blastocatellia bacterium]
MIAHHATGRLIYRNLSVMTGALTVTPHVWVTGRRYDPAHTFVTAG